MRLYQLDISWVASAQELTALRWQLASSDQVGGVFLTGREDTLAVLYAGTRHDFHQWARTLEPAFPNLDSKGALR
jgi:hypothetical protein